MSGWFDALKGYYQLVTEDGTLFPTRSQLQFHGLKLTDNGSRSVLGFNIVDVAAFDMPARTDETAVDVAFTVPGALVGDSIVCTPLGVWPDGLTIGPCRCLVDGTVQVRVGVDDGAPNPVSQTYRFCLMR